MRPQPDSDDEDEDDDKGKAPLRDGSVVSQGGSGLGSGVPMVSVDHHDEPAGHDATEAGTGGGEFENPPSTTSQGLPQYEAVTSSPAPVLDFDAFLAMTRPRTPKSSPKPSRP